MTIPVLTSRIGSWRFSVQRRAFDPAELGRRYDRAAPRWDRLLTRLGYPDAYETLFRSILKQEGLDLLQSRHRILDCGVGTGAASAALLAALAGMPAAGLELDAIDVSGRMLERADANLRRTGLDVTLRRGDMCEPIFPDRTFDLVIAAHTLEHVPRPALALREVVRVLKPGGLLIACLTRRSLLGAIVHLKHRTHRVTPVQAKRWLLESGLENVRCLPFGNRVLCRLLTIACLGRKPRSERMPRAAGERAVCGNAFANDRPAPPRARR